MTQLTRRHLLAGAAALPLAACGGLNVPVNVTIPESVQKVAADAADIAGAVEAVITKGQAIGGQVAAWVDDIKSAAASAGSAVSAVAAAPIVQKIEAAIVGLAGSFSGAGGKIAAVLQAAGSLLPVMKGLVGLAGGAPMARATMPPDDARKILRAARSTG